MTAATQIVNDRRAKRELYGDPDSPPKLIGMWFDGIPDELRREHRWVLWRLVLKNNRWAKVPMQCSGRPASSTDLQTWTTFDAAEKTYRRGGFDGLGFVLGNGWAGVDLDDVRVRDGKSWRDSEPAAFDLIQSYGGYSDISPSGTGYKIIGRGEWNTDWHRKPFGDHGAEIEVYGAGRYFAVTGHGSRMPVDVEKFLIPPHDAVARLDIQPLLDHVAATYGPKPETEIDTDLEDPPTPAAPSTPHTLSDDEIIDRAHRAKNGAKFASLWNGNTDDHCGDESRADLALCGMLAFWTGNDAKRLDNLFRRSKLLRGKWDEKRGEKTYGQRTIDHVLGNLKEVYTPPAPRATFKPTTKPTSGHLPRSDDEPRTAVEIILGHYLSLKPVFKVGNSIHTDDGETIAANVATAFPTSALLTKLATATNAPVKNGNVENERLPGLFSRWAKTAWGDLLDTLPDEDAADLGHAAPAAETFRRLVREAMLTEVVLGDIIGKEGVTQTERRSLIGWCERFAKRGRWEGIRSKKCWCKLRDVGGGEVELLVAIRHELFSQLRADKRLCEMGAKTFSRRAKRYGAGVSTTKERPGGQNAVVLSATLVADLIATLPDDDDELRDFEIPNSIRAHAQLGEG